MLALFKAAQQRQRSETEEAACPATGGAAPILRDNSGLSAKPQAAEAAFFSGSSRSIVCNRPRVVFVSQWVC